MRWRAFGDTGETYPGDANPSGAGNGSIMRLAPVPLAFAGDPREAIELAGLSSRTTHGAAQAVDACRYLGGLIVGALAGVSKDALLAPMFAPAKGMWEGEPLHDEIAEVAGGSFLGGSRPRSTAPGTWFGPWRQRYGPSPGARASKRVHCSPSTSAMTPTRPGRSTGNWRAPIYGVEAIPRSWRSQLTYHEDIVRFADGLLAFRQAREAVGS